MKNTICWILATSFCIIIAAILFTLFLMFIIYCANKQHQQYLIEEISKEEYYQINQWLIDEDRIEDIVKKRLEDGIITNSEYNYIHAAYLAACHESTCEGIEFHDKKGIKIPRTACVFDKKYDFND